MGCAYILCFFELNFNMGVQVMKKFNVMQMTLICCAIGSAFWLSAYWVFATKFANYWGAL